MGRTRLYSQKQQKLPFLCQRVGQLRGLSANTNYSSTTTVSKRASDGAVRHSCFHRKVLVPFSSCFCALQFWCRPSKHSAAQPVVPPAGSKVQMSSSGIEINWYQSTSLWLNVSLSGRCRTPPHRTPGSIVTLSWDRT